MVLELAEETMVLGGAAPESPASPTLAFGWRSAGVPGEPDFGFWVAQRFSAAIRAPLSGGFSR